MGGNAFENTRKVNGKDFDFIEDVFFSHEYEYALLGSTQKFLETDFNTNDSYDGTETGDFDIMVAVPIDRTEDFLESLKGQFDDYRAIGGEHHFLWKGNQIDVTIIPEVNDWQLEWARHASYSPNDEHKTLYRNELLFVTAKYLDPKPKVHLFGENGNVLDYERNTFSVKEGFRRARYTFASKKDPFRTNKNAQKVYSFVQIRDWEEYIDLFHGMEVEEGMTFEHLLQYIMHSDQFSEQSSVILREFARNIVVRKGLTLPEIFIKKVPPVILQGII